LCAPFSTGSFLASTAPLPRSRQSVRLPEIRQIGRLFI
jgi:hypothetical protein